MGRLEEIKEREAKATNGPWDIVEISTTNVRITWRPNDPEKQDMDAPICHMRWHSGLGGTLLYEDAHFIAQARSDIPWLIERLEEARRLLCPKAYDASISKWLKSLEES